MKNLKNVILSLVLFASLLTTNAQVLACHDCGSDDDSSYDSNWYFDEDAEWFDHSFYDDGWYNDGKYVHGNDWFFEEELPCEKDDDKWDVEEVIISNSYDCGCEKADYECGCEDANLPVATTDTQYGDYYAYQQGAGSSQVELQKWTSSKYMQRYIPEGATIRVEGGVDVYIVKYINGKMFKRLVLNPSVFENYGHLHWEDVMNVSQDVLDAYTTSEMVRSEETGRVYRLFPNDDRGTKRMVEVGGCFWNQIDQDSIYLINGFDERSYTTASVLE
jgi:hypothetical protein